MSDHKLFNQLMAANPSEEEVAELYDDLTFVFDAPFDDAIRQAMAERGCAYIEVPQPFAN